MRKSVEQDRRWLHAIPQRHFSRSFLHVLCLSAAVTCCNRTSDVARVSGTVEIRELQLAALAQGRVTRLYKDEGDSVRAGDTIAVLEQPGLEPLIQQRRAQAQAAASRTAEVAAALADSERTAADVRRAEPLRAQGIVSPQQFDGLRSAAAAAAARLQAVRAAMRDSAAARAALAGVEAIRGELTIIAPEGGIVLTRYADRGEALAAGTPVVSLGIVNRPWIRAYVSEPDLARIHLGQSVTIHMDGDPTHAVAGRLVDIASQAEFTPRAALTERERADLVFAIKVEFADSAGRLKAGMPVTLEIPLTP